MESPVKSRRTYNVALRQEQARLTRRRILDAARRLFVADGYANVTMRQVAEEAGVAVQTVYAVFGTKLALTQGMIEAAFADVDIPAQIRLADATDDPAAWLRTVARIARRVYDRLADVCCFLRESGDPQLVAEAEAIDRFRLENQAPLGPALAQRGFLREGLGQDEAMDLLWALSSPEWYTLLVRRRGWTPDNWEQWLGDALCQVILSDTARNQRLADQGA